MRTRAFLVIALFTLPIGLSGQGIRLPRGGRGTQPATLPPEIPAVARSLEMKRSRWSGEAYTMFSGIQVATTSGGSASYTGAGTGARGDYRFAEHFSATLDMTVSFLGTFATTETGEVGTRYSPVSRGQILRPYFDIRAAYTHMNDTYVIPTGGLQPVGGPNSQYTTGGYGHGFGAVAGAGFEYSVTNTLAVTTELLAVRSNMTTSRLTRSANTPANVGFRMNSLRYVLGLKYNPVQALHLVQKATP
jgi:hypothetical protein